MADSTPPQDARGAAQHRVLKEWKGSLELRTYRRRLTPEQLGIATDGYAIGPTVAIWSTDSSETQQAALLEVASAEFMSLDDDDVVTAMELVSAFEGRIRVGLRFHIEQESFEDHDIPPNTEIVQVRVRRYGAPALHAG